MKITRSLGKWYACFEHVIESQLLSIINQEVGIDVGTKKFTTYSDRTKIENPRLNRNSNSEFHQQNVSRKKKSSKRRKKAVRILTKVQKKEQNRRRDFQHKISRQIVANYAKIAFEKLKIKNMSKSAKGTIENAGTMVIQQYVLINLKQFSLQISSQSNYVV